MAAPELSVRVVSDFNSANFVGLLENDEGAPVVHAVDAGLRPVLPTLLEPEGPPTDALLVWTRPEAVLPAIARAAAAQPWDEAALATEVDAFAAAVRAASARARLVLVPVWVPPPGRGHGIADLRVGGVGYAVRAANARLADRLADLRSVFFLSTDRWLAEARRALEPRLWFMAKVPYGHDVFAAAARDVKAALRGVQGQARKVVVVDLDDTLWGGLVGEVGWEELCVGGHDALGEAYAAVQRELLALKRRGILLAIASKNDEAVALAALDRHPEMLLRRADFRAWRIHWGDKAQSLVDLAAELNVGLGSLVFLDDNPVERARIRAALPEVLVPELPADKLLVPAALAALDCFDAPTLTGEDARRGEMMAEGQLRDAARAEVGSPDEWLAELGTEVRVELLAGANLARAAQLLNKTNQLNLSTRRLTEEELLAWAGQPGRRVLTFRVADRFGDLGLTGLLGVESAGGALTVVDFVLSCRVMGRKIEELMVHAAVEVARARALETVVARYMPTERNRPCLDFWARSGFARDGEVFRWQAAQPYPRPAVLRVVGGFDG